jgi:hypothetical protein
MNNPETLATLGQQDTDLRYLCFFANSGAQHILCCTFVLFFVGRLVLLMLPVSLDCLIWISRSLINVSQQGLLELSHTHIFRSTRCVNMLLNSYKRALALL